ncbi:unnamed protein product [marine sediment metagenome]|uniref:Uncharacterized protein n=1 Tax=marine sediment metagenome TaxID=412755 RepID=X1QIM3_9ZZZZ
MTIKLTGAVRATIIEPNTPLTYTYTCGEDIPSKAPVVRSEEGKKVILAKADSWTTMPCIGFSIEAKSEGETVEVVSTGKLANVRKTEDLGYDAPIYISPDEAGKVTATPPEGTGKLVQQVGRGINATDITIAIDETVLELQEN